MIRSSTRTDATSFRQARMSIAIVDLTARDIRFPTSLNLAGSDAMNPDPDYSAAYVVLKTDSADGLEGHGLTFTIGRGNDLCAEAIRMTKRLLVGLRLDEIADDMAGFWRRVTGDSQMRWLGPDKGVVHLAAGAVVNAVWDLLAKREGKPVWKLLVDMTPEELVGCIDFRYIEDALSPEEALDILREAEPYKAAREAEMRAEGYPAYNTSAGWIGYSEEKLREGCRQAVAEGWDRLKMKVGRGIDEDIRRAQIIREEIGWSRQLMMDANQVWGVHEAIENMKRLARFKPTWIEEPTSPDDVLGHAAIRRALYPIGVATGEMCQNRILFKQLFQAEAIDVCQIDAARLGGVNEALAVILMAAKFGVPVCPHAGGVGLCEYVQHLGMFDFIAVSGSLRNRVIEYVEHLHEHFKYPVQLKNGRYMPPNDPGYSIEMKTESLDAHEYPAGQVWRELLKTH